MVTTQEIQQRLTKWAPPALAWEKDNIGLLVGNPSSLVRSILVTLDITPGVIEEAISKETNLIVAHHPIIFSPIKTIRTDTNLGSMLEMLVKNDIAVIAVHTNADAAQFGLNYHLAGALQLRNIAPLRETSAMTKKIVLWFDASEDAERKIREVMIAQSLPGFKNELIRGNEYRYEITAPIWLEKTITEQCRIALQRDHVFVESFPVDTSSSVTGIGAYGDLPIPLGSAEYIRFAKETLGCEAVRTNMKNVRQVHRVAVCGGSGSSYVADAIRCGADLFITADITYHTFFEHRDKIILVDAGHYETEHIFIEACARELRISMEGHSISVFTSGIDTNPVRTL